MLATPSVTVESGDDPRFAPAAREEANSERSPSTETSSSRVCPRAPAATIPSADATEYGDQAKLRSPAISRCSASAKDRSGAVTPPCCQAGHDVPVRQLLPDPADDLSDDDLLAAYAVPDGEHLRVNFVESADGAVTLAGKSGGLSGPADKRVFQLLRDLADVVLVAAGTIRNEGYGYPDLAPERRARRVRAGRPELPTFAIVSRSLDLDLSSSLFTDAPVRTVVLTDGTAPADRRKELEAYAEVVVTGGLDGHVRALRERGHDRILCEGGPSLFGGLAREGLLDELCLTVSPLLAGPGPGRIVAGPEHEPIPLTLTTLLEEDGALFHRFAVRKGE